MRFEVLTALAEELVRVTQPGVRETGVATDAHSQAEHEPSALGSLACKVGSIQSKEYPGVCPATLQMHTLTGSTDAVRRA